MRIGRLSPKQREIATYGAREKRWTLVSGPVGAGKTEAGLIGFLLWQQRWSGAQFGVLTKGHKQLQATLFEGIERILGEPLKTYKEGYLLPSMNGGTNYLLPFVGQDKRAEPRLRSLNLSGMVIDELTTLPYTLLGAANARCRVGPAKIIGMTNPDGPLHPVKLNYFDCADDIDAEVHWTKLADNPSLTKEYIDSLSAHYSGHMLDRMVNGLWASATGLVYPHAADVAGEAPDVEFVAYDVAVDVGEANVTHALLSGRTADGKTWILGEWRHDHVAQGKLREAALIAKLRTYFSGYDVHSWIVDPAAKTFRQELLKQLGPKGNVGKAYNDWTEGVEEVNHWIATESLFLYGRNLPYLMAEIGSLIYDAEQALLGKDVPVKVPDHGTDAMRYLVLTRAVDEAGGRRTWEAIRQRRKEKKT